MSANAEFSKPYSRLDLAIISEIREGLDTLSQFDHALWIANQITEKDAAGRSLGERLICRRLQALRKSGEIRFKHGRWVVLEFK